MQNEVTGNYLRCLFIFITVVEVWYLNVFLHKPRVSLRFVNFWKLILSNSLFEVCHVLIHRLLERLKNRKRGRRNSGGELQMTQEQSRYSALQSFCWMSKNKQHSGAFNRALTLKDIVLTLFHSNGYIWRFRLQLLSWTSTVWHYVMEGLTRGVMVNANISFFRCVNWQIFIGLI